MAKNPQARMTETIPLASPDITQREIDAVVAVLEDQHLSLGPRVPAFEQAVASYVGCEHGVALSSGTAGLHLIVHALGIGEGDEVVTPSFSFIASSNCVVFERAKPVFADIDPVTWDMDPAAAEAAITLRTKALLPVHVFGRPCPMPAYNATARKHGLHVIEDSCEALGSAIDGKFAGSFGDAGVFGFYPNKQITTGEGGVVVTDNEELAIQLRSLRNQGRSPDASWLEHDRLGWNYRIPDILCALGIVQVERLEEFVVARQNAYERYNAALADLTDDVILPPPGAANQRMSWFVYVIALKEGTSRERRDAVIRELQGAGVGCRNYFSPIHLQPFYKETYGCREGMLPVTENVANRTIALPFFNRITDEQITRVRAELERALVATSNL